uniref:Uncharacterized protein n=1 Tax=Oryza brachyantha TaxID=4533 RepID=J3MZ68_ORYBR
MQSVMKRLPTEFGTTLALHGLTLRTTDAYTVERGMQAQMEQLAYSMENSKDAPNIILAIKVLGITASTLSQSMSKSCQLVP